MLLQTNSYVVPAERRADHNRLMRRFRQTLLRLGCDHFEVYEQAGTSWSGADPSGRFVQILRFADRKHQLSIQAAEKKDAQAQSVIADFCDLIGIAEQLEQGLFVTGYYTGVVPTTLAKVPGGVAAADGAAADGVDVEPAFPAEGDADGHAAAGVPAGATVAPAMPAVPPLAADFEPPFDDAFDAAVGGGADDYDDEIVVRPVRSFTTAVESAPSRPATASDPVVGDVLVGDDLAASVPAPSHTDDAGGTGLPAMFSDDYFDEPAAGGGPEPVGFDFDDADAANKPASR